MAHSRTTGITCFHSGWQVKTGRDLSRPAAPAREQHCGNCASQTLGTWQVGTLTLCQGHPRKGAAGRGPAPREKKLWTSAPGSGCRGPRTRSTTQAPRYSCQRRMGHRDARDGSCPGHWLLRRLAARHGAPPRVAPCDSAPNPLQGDTPLLPQTRPLAPPPPFAPPAQSQSHSLGPKPVPPWSFLPHPRVASWAQGALPPAECSEAETVGCGLQRSRLRGWAGRGGAVPVECGPGRRREEGTPREWKAIGQPRNRPPRAGAGRNTLPYPAPPHTAALAPSLIPPAPLPRRERCWGRPWVPPLRRLASPLVAGPGFQELRASLSFSPVHFPFPTQALVCFLSFRGTPCPVLRDSFPCSAL